MPAPVFPLSHWTGDFQIDDVRVNRNRLWYSAITPPIKFITGLSKVVDSDDCWLSLQLSATERNKLQDIEERILKLQPDGMKFRSSWKDGGLDAWLNDETLFYSADKVLLQERPKFEPDTVVRALISLPELTYAKSEYGALWRVEQLWMPRARFVFDDHASDDGQQAEDADGAHDIDDELPSREGLRRRTRSTQTPPPPAEPEDTE